MHKAMNLLYGKRDFIMESYGNLQIGQCHFFFSRHVSEFIPSPTYSFVFRHS